MTEKGSEREAETAAITKGWGRGMPVPDGKIPLQEVIVGALPDGYELFCVKRFPQKNAYGGDTCAVILDLEDLARAGRIRVWGHDRARYDWMNPAETPLELIPPSHWEKCNIAQFDPTDDLSVGRTVWTTEERQARRLDESEIWLANADPEGKFIALLFDRAEIEQTIFKKKYRTAAEVDADREKEGRRLRQEMAALQAARDAAQGEIAEQPAARREGFFRRLLHAGRSRSAR